ncbi:hypothetical protein MGYG_06657 [Nannizzia gypsea CBS 118893]|uniref:Uncharacterized protein n=1 Tax=Arthroderma gypseum (strain ATCC MYA-4604 / CBS 118893) TaxID=535722 RepID=E4V0U6_ARTGP|nr:hypothetical protein MGYG_06657 [Nannizzia gypsea CBS 118893]EFR03661.1 hypothetical protein MGYG_06657 [Nannizzia gypsea CBS 118893]
MAETDCYEKYPFGEHYLQNVYVHIPEAPAPIETGYWIVERRVKIVEDMVDTHDGMWINGKEVAGVIAVGIRELQDMRV